MGVESNDGDNKHTFIDPKTRLMGAFNYYVGISDFYRLTNNQQNKK
jgi:hypothetical protein